MCVNGSGAEPRRRILADDVKSLQELSRKRAAKARERYALLAAELYRAPRGLLADAERSSMTGMIAGLIARISTMIDADTSGGEATVEALRRAGVLEDPDLVAAAYHRMLEFEIERRAAGNDTVASLSAGHDLEVIHAVTEYLVGRAKRVDGYGNPVLETADLPPALAGRLLWSVAAARRGDDPAREDAIESSACAALAAHRDPPEPAPMLAARRLHEAGAAGPDLLVPLIEAGEVALSEALLAELARIPMLLARRFLFEPGGESLAIAARTTELDRATLIVMLEAGRHARPRGGDCAAALALFDRLDVETARRALRGLGRHPDYQEALRRLEG